MPWKLQENTREAGCPQRETSKLGSWEDARVHGNVIVLVSLISWYVCQKRKDTIKYRELWRARGVWSSVVGDSQTNVSCTTILPQARAATNHSRPPVRMIHLGGSNLNTQVSLHWKMCHPCLADLWSFSFLLVPSSPTPKCTTSRSREGNRIQGRPALGERAECVGDLKGPWDRAD